MKRQQIRKLLLIISMLTFPITLYYLSPALIIQGAAGGIITGSFIVFTMQFLLSLVFGRAFCSYICPAGGVQEACTLMVNKKAKGGKLDWIKYIIWVVWLSIITLMFVLNKNPLKIDFLYQTNNGISVSEPLSYIIYYIVIALIVGLALTTGKRGFCHYVCWMAPFMIVGSRLKKDLNIPSLNLKSEREKCINCKKCSQVCPMSLNVNEMVQKGDNFNTECILCGECIDSCPKKVLSYHIGRCR
jgi:Polyferredoxin